MQAHQSMTPPLLSVAHLHVLLFDAVLTHAIETETPHLIFPIQRNSTREHSTVIHTVGQ